MEWRSEHVLEPLAGTEGRRDKRAAYRMVQSVFVFGDDKADDGAPIVFFVNVFA